MESLLGQACDRAVTAREVANEYGVHEATERIQWAIDFLAVAIDKVKAAG